MHTHEGSFCPYLKCHTQGKPPHVECILEKVKRIIHLPYDKQHQLCFLFGFFVAVLVHTFFVFLVFCLFLLHLALDGWLWAWSLIHTPVDSDLRWTFIQLDLSCSQGEGLEIGLSSDWIVSPEARVQERSKRRHVIFWLGHTGALH